MTGYQKFAALVKKEAKTLWGAAVALMVLVIGMAAVQIYYYLRYPEIFSSTLDSAHTPLHIPLYREFTIASSGITYTIQMLLPIVLVLYLFIGERLSRTHVQLHALPTRRAWWLTAKVIVPAAILGPLYALSLFLNAVLAFVSWTYRDGGYPAHSEILALFSRGGGVFYLLNIVLQSTVLLTSVTFLAYAAAISTRRHRTAVWIIVMVAVMACVPLLDTQLRPMFSGYVGQLPRMDYRPYGWYLVGYPLAWIALTLGAGVFIHEKYGEA